MICDDIFVTSSGEMKLKKAVHTVRRNGRKDFLLLYVLLTFLNSIILFPPFYNCVYFTLFLG